MAGVEINRVACTECGFVVLRPIVNVSLDRLMEEYPDFLERCKHQEEAGIDPERCPSFKRAYDQVPKFKIVP